MAEETVPNQTRPEAQVQVVKRGAAGSDLKSDPPEPPRASGICAVGSRHVWLEGCIDFFDEALIDFDVHALGADGLYALELIEEGRVRWRGCRRFGTAPDGSRVVFEFDGKPEPITRLALGFRIAGRVLEVSHRVRVGA